ncbi:MAG: FHA domain-containing protein, partial [Thermoleophilaceae bacterium]
MLVAYAQPLGTQPPPLGEPAPPSGEPAPPTGSQPPTGEPAPPTDPLEDARKDLEEIDRIIERVEPDIRGPPAPTGRGVSGRLFYLGVTLAFSVVAVMVFLGSEARRTDRIVGGGVAGFATGLAALGQFLPSSLAGNVGRFLVAAVPTIGWQVGLALRAARYAPMESATRAVGVLLGAALNIGAFSLIAAVTDTPLGFSSTPPTWDAYLVELAKYLLAGVIALETPELVVALRKRIALSLKRKGRVSKRHQWDGEAPVPLAPRPRSAPESAEPAPEAEQVASAPQAEQPWHVRAWRRITPDPWRRAQHAARRAGPKAGAPYIAAGRWHRAVASMGVSHASGLRWGASALIFGFATLQLPLARDSWLSGQVASTLTLVPVSAAVMFWIRRYRKVQRSVAQLRRARAARTGEVEQAELEQGGRLWGFHVGDGGKRLTEALGLEPLDYRLLDDDTDFARFQGDVAARLWELGLGDQVEGLLGHMNKRRKAAGRLRQEDAWIRWLAENTRPRDFEGGPPERDSFWTDDLRDIDSNGLAAVLDLGNVNYRALDEGEFGRFRHAVTRRLRELELERWAGRLLKHVDQQWSAARLARRERVWIARLAESAGPAASERDRFRTTDLRDVDRDGLAAALDLGNVSYRALDKKALRRFVSAVARRLPELGLAAEVADLSKHLWEAWIDTRSTRSEAVWVRYLDREISEATGEQALPERVRVKWADRRSTEAGKYYLVALRRAAADRRRAERAGLWSRLGQAARRELDSQRALLRHVLTRHLVRAAAGPLKALGSDIRPLILHAPPEPPGRLRRPAAELAVLGWTATLGGLAWLTAEGVNVRPWVYPLVAATLSAASVWRWILNRLDTRRAGTMNDRLEVRRKAHRAAAATFGLTLLIFGGVQAPAFFPETGVGEAILAAGLGLAAFGAVDATLASYSRVTEQRSLLARSGRARKVVAAGLGLAVGAGLSVLIEPGGLGEAATWIAVAVGTAGSSFVKRYRPDWAARLGRATVGAGIGVVALAAFGDPVVNPVDAMDWLGVLGFQLTVTAGAQLAVNLAMEGIARWVRRLLHAQRAETRAHARKAGLEGRLERSAPGVAALRLMVNAYAEANVGWREFRRKARNPMVQAVLGVLGTVQLWFVSPTSPWGVVGPLALVSVLYVLQVRLRDGRYGEARMPGEADDFERYPRGRRLGAARRAARAQETLLEVLEQELALVRALQGVHPDWRMLGRTWHARLLLPAPARLVPGEDPRSDQAGRRRRWRRAYHQRWETTAVLINLALEIQVAFARELLEQHVAPLKRRADALPRWLGGGLQNAAELREQVVETYLERVLAGRTIIARPPARLLPRWHRAQIRDRRAKLAAIYAELEAHRAQIESHLTRLEKGPWWISGYVKALEQHDYGALDARLWELEPRPEQTSADETYARLRELAAAQHLFEKTLLSKEKTDSPRLDYGLDLKPRVLAWLEDYLAWVETEIERAHYELLVHLERAVRGAHGWAEQMNRIAGRLGRDGAGAGYATLAQKVGEAATRAAELAGRMEQPGDHQPVSARRLPPVAPEDLRQLQRAMRALSETFGRDARQREQTREEMQARLLEAAEGAAVPERIEGLAAEADRHAEAAGSGAWMADWNIQAFAVFRLLSVYVAITAEHARLARDLLPGYRRRVPRERGPAGPQDGTWSEQPKTSDEIKALAGVLGKLRDEARAGRAPAGVELHRERGPPGDDGFGFYKLDPAEVELLLVDRVVVDRIVGEGVGEGVRMFALPEDGGGRLGTVVALRDAANEQRQLAPFDRDLPAAAGRHEMARLRGQDPRDERQLNERLDAARGRAVGRRQASPSTVPARVEVRATELVATTAGWPLIEGLDMLGEGFPARVAELRQEGGTWSVRLADARFDLLVNDDPFTSTEWISLADGDWILVAGEAPVTFRISGGARQSGGRRPPSRIAVLANAEGNLEALRAVLDDIAAVAGDVEIWNGGHSIGGAASPNEVLDLLGERAAVSVAGVPDQALLEGDKDDPLSLTSQLHQYVRRAVAWTESQLSGENRVWLRGLPRFDERHAGVALYHVSPGLGPGMWGISDLLTPADAFYFLPRDVRIGLVGQPPEPAAYVQSRPGGEPEALALADGSPVDISAGRVPLAPGRVNARTARWLLVDLEAETATLHEVPYDYRATVAAMEEAGLPAGLRKGFATPRPTGLSPISRGDAATRFALIVLPLGDLLALRGDTGNRIGRMEGEVDVYLPDRSVSRDHAELVIDVGRIYVRDHDSSNGTYVLRVTDESARVGSLTVPSQLPIPSDQLAEVFPGETLIFGGLFVRLVDLAAEPADFGQLKPATVLLGQDAVRDFVVGVLRGLYAFTGVRQLIAPERVVEAFRRRGVDATVWDVTGAGLPVASFTDYDAHGRVRTYVALVGGDPPPDEGEGDSRGRGGPTATLGAFIPAPWSNDATLAETAAQALGMPGLAGTVAVLVAGAGLTAASIPSARHALRNLWDRARAWMRGPPRTVWQLRESPDGGSTRRRSRDGGPGSPSRYDRPDRSPARLLVDASKAVARAERLIARTGRLGGERSDRKGLLDRLDRALTEAEALVVELERRPATRVDGGRAIRERLATAQARRAALASRLADGEMVWASAGPRRHVERSGDERGRPVRTSRRPSGMRLVLHDPVLFGP